MEKTSKKKATQSLKVAGIVAALGSVAVLGATPLWRKLRDERRTKECQENLTKIDGAKEQYALENNKKPGQPVGWSDIVDPRGGTGYLKEKLHCPAGHEYVINVVGTAPTCGSGLEGHTLSLVQASTSSGLN